MTSPVYIVDAANTHFAKSLARAFMAPNLDLMLRDILADQWRGRGLAIVFDAKQFTGATVFFGTILHELAHDLADGGQAARLEPELPPAKVERITAATKEHISTPYWEDAEGITCSEFVGHDDRWIRCCVHLSVCAGLSPFHVIGDRAEISSPIAYEAALADEPYRLIDCPLSTILDSQAPEAFRMLWATDVLNFAESRKAKHVALLNSDSPKETCVMSASILDKVLSTITGRVRDKHLSAVQRFTALAKNIADGKDVDATEAETVLEAAGKTPDDLKAAVENIVQRRGLQQSVNRAKGVAKAERSLRSAPCRGKDRV